MKLPSFHKKNEESVGMITVLGFGSLLSQKSSRLTFPNLSNFRLGRVHHHRRVFAHPAPIFFERGIANMKTLEISSLSAEYVPPTIESIADNTETTDGYSFICTVFEVPREELLMEVSPDDEKNLTSSIIPSKAFLEREEEFNIQVVEYEEINSDYCNEKKRRYNTGILCLRSTDDAYKQRWGNKRFEEKFKKWGLDSIWHWDKDSGMRPCAPYLRHCVLASKSMGEECYNSFLDDTFLIDRKTTIRTYLNQYPHIMTTLPPAELAERYGG